MKSVKSIIATFNYVPAEKSVIYLTLINLSLAKIN